MKKFKFYSLLATLCLLFGSSLSYGQTEKKLNNEFIIHYKTDAWRLNASQKKRLKTFFGMMNPDSFTFNIEGHTDSVGTDKYNLILSQKRAYAVKNWFLLNGFLTSPINYKGCGENLPYIGKISDLASNRRTLIKFSKRKSGWLCRVETLTGTKNNHSTIFDLYNELESKYDTFVINSNRDTMINCPRGSMVFIKKHSFKTNENCDGLIKIVVKEVLNPNDMITQNTETVSGDSILQTGGMINIRAFDCNNELSLDSNKKLAIWLPQSTNLGKMNVFNATRDNAQNLNWQKTNNNSYYFLSRFWYFRYPSNKGCRRFLFFGLRHWLNRDYNTYKKCACNSNHRYDGGDDYASTIYRSFYSVTNAKERDSILRSFGYYEIEVDNRDIKTRKSDAMLHYLYGYNQTPVINQANRELNYTLMEVNNTGWANSDQFYKAKSFLTLSSEIYADSFTDLKIVFQQRRPIVIGAIPINGLLSFPNIPKGGTGLLIGLRYVNKVPYYASKIIKIDKDADLTLDFKETTLEALKDRISKEANFDNAKSLGQVKN